MIQRWSDDAEESSTISSLASHEQHPISLQKRVLRLSSPLPVRERMKVRVPIQRAFLAARLKILLRISYPVGRPPPVGRAAVPALGAEVTPRDGVDAARRVGDFSLIEIPPL
jgi:hypothetical protein